MLLLRDLLPVERRPAFMVSRLGISRLSVLTQVVPGLLRRPVCPANACQCPARQLVACLVSSSTDTTKLSSSSCCTPFGHFISSQVFAAAVPFRSSLTFYSNVILLSSCLPRCLMGLCHLDFRLILCPGCHVLSKV